MIMDALLEGKEISAKEFANRHMVSDTMVTGVLKALGTALNRREQSVKVGRRGCKMVYYSVKDRAAVQSARDIAASKKVPNQWTNKGLALIDLDFEPLLACWGINSSDRAPIFPAKLPTFVHRIETKADELEAEEC